MNDNHAVPGDPDSLDLKSSSVPDKEPPITEIDSLNEPCPSDRELAKWESFGRVLGQAMLAGDGESPTPEMREIGRFSVLRRLGRGGSGTVYQALDPILQRSVAIKLLHPGLVSSVDSLDRFLQEGKLLSLLSHSNIVAIHEVGFERDCPFLVFEYCAGGSLADWLAQRTQYLLPRTCARIIVTLAAALHFAHARQILHRDVNPRNVLLVPLPDGQQTGHEKEFPLLAKLSDFGLGTWLDEQKTAVQTQAGAVMGTLPYMAPEQTKASALPLQATVDVYALGVILYELLTRQRPFVGETPLDTLRLIRDAEPTRPSALRKEIPRDLETICLKCLEKSSTRRYRTAATLSEDLEHFLMGSPIRSRRVSYIERSIRWLVVRRAQVGIVALVLVLLATIGVGSSWYAGKLNDARNAERTLKLASDAQATKFDDATASHLQDQRAKDNSVRRVTYNNQITAISGLVDTRSYDVVQRLREWIPKTDDEPDFRDFEWYYLMRACGGDIVPFITLTDPKAEVEAMHVSETGDRVYLASGNKITEWQSPWDRPSRTIHDSKQTIRDFAVNEKLKQLAVTEYESDTIGFYDLTSTSAKHIRDSTKTIVPWFNRISYISGHPQVRFVALGSNSKDFRSPTHVYVHAFGKVYKCWSPTRPAGRIFDTVTESMAGTGRLIGAIENGIYVWGSRKLPEQHLRLTSDNELITSLAISTDGQILAAASEMHDIFLCSRKQSTEWEILGTLPVKNRRATSTSLRLVHNRNPIRFSPDGSRLFSSSDTELHLWDVARLRDLRAVDQIPGNLRHLELLSDGKTAIWTTAQAVGLWRPIEDIAPLKGHDKEAWSVGFSPDGKQLATGSDDNTVRLWDLANGMLLTELTGHHTTVAYVAFSPQGALIASGSLDGTILIWDATSHQLVATLKGDMRSIRALAWFADEKRLAVSDSPNGNSSQQRVMIWDVKSGSLVRTFVGPDRRIHSVIVTPDQRQIIGCAADRTTCIWNVEGGELVQSWTANSGIRSALLLKDGRFLATGSSNGMIQIRNIATGSMVPDLLGHTAPIVTLAISPNGRILASGGEDKTVRLWDVETGHCLMVFKDQPVQINSVAFSPSGEILATAGHDGSVRLRYAPRFKPLLSNLSE